MRKLPAERAARRQQQGEVEQVRGRRVALCTRTFLQREKLSPARAQSGSSTVAIEKLHADPPPIVVQRSLEIGHGKADGAVAEIVRQQGQRLALSRPVASVRDDAAVQDGAPASMDEPLVATRRLPNRTDAPSSNYMAR